MNKKNFIQSWISDFKYYNPTMIQELINYNPEEWKEITVNGKINLKRSLLPDFLGLYSFSEKDDLEWLEKGGLQHLLEKGFFVYQNPNYGYIFAASSDSPIYNYKHCWKPLFEARYECLND